MSKTNGNKHTKHWPLWLWLFPLVDFFILIKVLLRNHNVALFNSKGFIANQEQQLMVFTVVVLLLVIVPTLFMLYFVAWKYREGSPNAQHEPNMRHSKYLDLKMWLIPVVTMIILASVMWPATHLYAPQRAIHNGTKPLTVQVISMRWKWLFIYPEQRVATVNYLQIPVDTPIQFQLTADDAPMSSFWIPNLSGMLYTMTGHLNELNIIADTPGDFPGSSAEISGKGFADMKFTTRVSTAADFQNWVASAKDSNTNLDASSYAELLKPSEGNPVTIYANADTSLYDKVLMKYMAPGDDMAHGAHYE